MGSKDEYEARKAGRKARREHLDENDQRQLDIMDQMDRLIVAFEGIAQAMSGIEMNTRSNAR